MCVTIILTIRKYLKKVKHDTFSTSSWSVQIDKQVFKIDDKHSTRVNSL